MERVQKVHSITNAQTAAQPKTQEEHLFKGRVVILFSCTTKTEHSTVALIISRGINDKCIAARIQDSVVFVLI